MDFLSFLIPNDEIDHTNFFRFATSVEYIEFRTGLELWGKLKGAKVEKDKKRVNK